MHFLRIQSICVSISIVFALFIFSSIIINSFNRQSVLGAFDNDTDNSIDNTSEGYFELNDFDRFEVKQGELSWRIKADKARYFASDKLTQIVNADIHFNRVDGTTLELSSEKAKIFGEGKGATRAEFEGNVKVHVSDGISIFGNYAVYKAEERKIILPDGSLLKGSGFEVSGDVMDVLTESKEVSIRGGVTSIFEQNAKLPHRKNLLNVFGEKK